MFGWHCGSVEELNSLSKEDLAFLIRDLEGHCQENKMQGDWFTLRICERELALMRERLNMEFGDFCSTKNEQ